MHEIQPGCRSSSDHDLCSLLHALHLLCVDLLLTCNCWECYILPCLVSVTPFVETKDASVGLRISLVAKIHDLRFNYELADPFLR